MSAEHRKQAEEEKSQNERITNDPVGRLPAITASGLMHQLDGATIVFRLS